MDFALRPGETLIRSQRSEGRYPFPASWRRIVPDGGGPAQDRFEGPRKREVLSLLRDLLADSGRCLPLDELKAKLSGRNVTEQVRAPRAVPAAAWRGGLGVCRTPGLVLAEHARSQLRHCPIITIADYKFQIKNQDKKVLGFI